MTDLDRADILEWKSPDGVLAELPYLPVVGIHAERLCLYDRIADSCITSSSPCVIGEGMTIDPTFERDVQECDIPPDVLVEVIAKKDTTTGEMIEAQQRMGIRDQLLTAVEKYEIENGDLNGNM